MAKKTLAEVFELHSSKKEIIPILSDYDVFQDKVLLDQFRKRIIQNLLDHNLPEGELLKEYIDREIDRTLEGYDLSSLERSHIFHLIDNEIHGYGPITELLEDEQITEIMINGPDEIYVEIDGKVLRDETVSFINEEHILRTIERMVQPMGRTIDQLNPMVDGRLPDGSRFNAIIPPLSLKGPILTVRKFRDHFKKIDDLLRSGTVTPYMARFLEAAVKAKMNIMISGGTGSGKTTLLNVLSSFIGNNERIITIEDAAELRLLQKHVISLETRSTNYETGEEVTVRDLVINCLRMRPDRIIIGEVRGKEALDMLQAMNTGHEGSLTTLHANGPTDALHRLETMVLMSGMELPVSVVREYIEKAIDLVVQIERLPDGRRKVTSISEIVGFKEDEIKLKEIFAFRQKGILPNGQVDGEFVLYNYLPESYKRIQKSGIDDLDDIFEPIVLSEKRKRETR